MLIRRVFILKPTERTSVLLKNGPRDFQNNSLFKRSAYFHVIITRIIPQVCNISCEIDEIFKSTYFEKYLRTTASKSLEILKTFNTVTLKHVFWKTKTFFKKLKNRFLIENTVTENAIFPFKTALSKVNVKKNRLEVQMDLLKRISFFLWKSDFGMRNFYK